MMSPSVSMTMRCSREIEILILGLHNAVSGLE